MTSFIARNPVDLLAVVPCVLGFHPEDSVVLLTFDDRETQSFHARVDLPVVAAEQEQVAAMLRAVAARNGARRVGIVLYTEDAGAADAFQRILVPWLDRDGVEVVDVLRVAGDHFHPADEVDHPGIPYDLSSHPFTAARVMEGRVTFDSRQDLADSLVGADADDTEEIAAAADAFADRLLLVGSRTARRSGRRGPLVRALSTELREHARWLQDRLRSAGDAGAAPLSAIDAGRVLVLVALDTLREVAVAELTRPTAAAQLDLWRDLSRRAPADLRSAPASLCALAGWLAGEGALAWCALERCFETDPDDVLAHHVAALLESATPPAVWSPVPQSALRVFGGSHPGTVVQAGAGGC